MHNKPVRESLGRGPQLSTATIPGTSSSREPTNVARRKCWLGVAAVAIRSLCSTTCCGAARCAGAVVWRLLRHICGGGEFDLDILRLNGLGRGGRPVLLCRWCGSPPDTASPVARIPECHVTVAQRRQPLPHKLPANGFVVFVQMPVDGELSELPSSNISS